MMIRAPALAPLVLILHQMMAKRHWSNLYGLLSRAGMDAHKPAGVQSEAVNPLSGLAECFNDYESFQPQKAIIYTLCKTQN